MSPASWLESKFGSNEGELAKAKIAPVVGSIATTAPVLPLRDFIAAAWASGSIVSRIAPPFGSRFANSCCRRSTKKRLSLPASTLLASDSIPVAP